MRSDAICLGFTHLVSPQLADEHVHDLRAMDLAPLGKVVRLAHRVVHTMDSDAVVLDVVPHTNPTRQIMIQVESGFDHLPLRNVRISPMPTLIIDADACPVTREALACARSARIPVLIAGNSTQNLARRIRRDDPRDAEHARGRDATHPGFWAETLDVSCGADSADFAIIERLEPGDVVVTQDIGLASMVLGRGAAAIGVRGHVYNKATIDMQLFIRHEEKKVRRAGGRTQGPAAFTDDDRERFQRNLAQLLREALNS